MATLFAPQLLLRSRSALASRSFPLFRIASPPVRTSRFPRSTQCPPLLPPPLPLLPLCPRARLYATKHPPQPAPKSLTRTRRRKIWLATIQLVVTLTAGALLYVFIEPIKDPLHLNPEVFARHFVVAHEPVATSPSKTSLITLVPEYLPPAGEAAPAPPQIGSVEIQNPLMQIVRRYTPLPPPESHPHLLRFLVKLEPDGEMSRYLHSLPVGAQVYLRGLHEECPESEFGFRPAAKTLFLAGGTGLAPGLQLAEKLLSRDGDAQMRILWGVRHAQEATGPVVRVMEELKRRYKGRFEVKVFPDSKGGIGKREVASAVSDWGARNVLVSGPEGFVAHWAGAKAWVKGATKSGPYARLAASPDKGVEVQGPVGGVLGGVLKGRDDVCVWKL